MRKLKLLSFAAVVGIAGAASAQTAGGPAQASPGASPSQTPLTSSGAPRTPAPAAPAPAPAPADSSSPATPAIPGAVGASKPARPAHRATVRHRASRSHKPAATDQGTTSQ